MIIGLIFILAGVLIALYPPLLSIIVASILIIIGVHILLISYYYKKIAKHFDNPFMDFFVRF